MQRVTIYGTSDDLVEVEGIIGGDEFNTDRNDTVNLCIGGILLIKMSYGKYGATWTTEMGQMFDDVPIPYEWDIFLTQHSNGYSVQVNLDIPDGIGVVFTGDRE